MATQSRDVIDVAWSGSTVAIRFGRHAIPCLKLEGGDSLKPEKLTPLGMQAYKSRTMGDYETEAGSVEMEAAEWQRMQGYLPENGFGNFEFPVLATQSHPELGTYTVLYDKCRIVGVKEPLEAGAAKATLSLDVMQIWRKGKDGKWRTLNQIPSQPSPDAAQMML